MLFLQKPKVSETSKNLLFFADAQVKKVVTKLNYEPYVKRVYWNLFNVIRLKVKYGQVYRRIGTK